MQQRSRLMVLRMHPPMTLPATHQTPTLRTPLQKTVLQMHLQRTRRTKGKLKAPRMSRHLTSRPTLVTAATMQQKTEGRMPKTLARRTTRKLQMKRKMLELLMRRMLKLQMTRRQRRRNRHGPAGRNIDYVEELARLAVA